MSSSRWQNVVTGLAAVAIVLLAANVVLIERHRTAQAEVSRRAQYIQQTVQLERLHREIINAIANLSMRNNDEALKALLTQHGIMINAPQAPMAPAAVPPTPGRK
jgi:hypothetical protein